MPHVTSHARYLPYKMTLSSEAEDINDEGLVEFTQNHCNESENGFMDKTRWHGDLIMSQSGHRRPPAAKPYYIRHHQRVEEHELRAQSTVRAYELALSPTCHMPHASHETCNR